MLKVLIVGGGSAYAQMYRSAGWAITTDIYQADLVQFTGGEDVTPALYGEERHPTTGNSKERDLFEGGYFAIAQRLGTPVVGICRGGQFLNVMCGGKMYQHVSKHAIGTTHALTDVSTGNVVEVSSTHHQMMRAGPKGELIATAELGGFKQFMGADGKVATADPEEHLDTEVVFYPTNKALCFQPHPESFQPEHECFQYFFAVVGRCLGLWGAV